MENKEAIKKYTKIKLLVMALSTLLPIILLVLFGQKFFKDYFVVYNDLVVLRYVIFALLEGYILFKIYRYIRILKDEDYCEKVILRKTDERLKFIGLKSHYLAIKIFIYVCGIALIVAGFMNSIMFYTLLGVIFTIAIIFVAVSIYYSKKY